MSPGVPQRPCTKRHLLLSDHLPSYLHKAESRSSDQSERQDKDSSSQVGHIHAHSESSVSAAAQDSSVPASNSATLEAVSELRSWKKRGQERNIWTVNHVEGMKLRMNKRRRPSYRPEDQEAFYRLLGVCSERTERSGPCGESHWRQWLWDHAQISPPWALSCQGSWWYPTQRDLDSAGEADRFLLSGTSS